MTTRDDTATTGLELELDDAWAYGGGILHGGWLLETVAAAALERTDHPHPLAVSAQFSSRTDVGAAAVEVERVREGRSVASLRARLLQQDRVKVDVLLSAGTLPGVDTAPYRVDAAPPVLPGPDDCPRNTMPEGQPRNGILEQLDVRLDPRTAGFLHGEPGGGAEVRAWVRSADGREPDPLLLLTVADALPPVTFELGLPGWVPTVELTVHLRAVPAPGWLRCVQRATVLHGGWLDEECQVWDSAGRLVAQARQLAAYREPRS
ncbi:MAG TPA: thioesterase family protein [Mycobacteriales bacterium]|nr:thioesterase family protein [Mycobacteriales bacterium]